MGQEHPGPQRVLFYELLLLGTPCPFLIAPLDQCKADLGLIYSLLFDKKLLSFVLTNGVTEVVVQHLWLLFTGVCQSKAEGTVGAECHGASSKDLP